jgi:hypothetical protein
MFMGKPDIVMDWAENPDRSYLLEMRINISGSLYENRFASPTERQYVDVAEFIEEISGLRLDGEQTRGLLALYPPARIKVALDGVGDTDSRYVLSFAISHFVLGCAWPTYGDGLDVEEFVKVLQQQAAKLGLRVAKES